MSELQKKHKQLKRLRIRNITLNTVCILLALAGISWTINYFWKYVHYEITNDAVVDQYIAPLNIRASGYIKEVRFTEHQPVHAGDTLLILDNREYLIKVKDAEAALMDAKGAKDVLSSGIQTSQYCLGATLNTKSVWQTYCEIQVDYFLPASACPTEILSIRLVKW